MSYLKNIIKVYRFDEIESEVNDAKSREYLFSKESFSKKIYGRLDEMIPENGILSLDVFDTLLLRDSSSELKRFYEIGGLMASFINDAYESDSISPKNILFPVKDVDAFWARYMGTKATYRASKPIKGCREGSLNEIHSTASKLLCGSESLADAFIDIEIDYETTRLMKNELILNYALKHRARGGKVILVSDMYMHSSQISDLLNRLDIDAGLFGHIFSSADTKVSKASGGIFSRIQSVLKAESKDFLHVGDSYSGDYKKPKESGWNALHIPIPKSEIIERRKDHLKTAKYLKEKYSLSVDVAMP